jgi:hypothetical protein
MRLRKKHSTVRPAAARPEEVIKAKTGTKTRSPDKENSIVSSTERKRDMSQEIALTPRRPKKG